MLDRRQSQALDNYITGHYGEDQYRDIVFCPKCDAELDDTCPECPECGFVLEAEHDDA